MELTTFVDAVEVQQHDAVLESLEPGTECRVEIVRPSGQIGWSGTLVVPDPRALRVTPSPTGITVRVPAFKAHVGDLIVDRGPTQIERFASTRKEGTTLLFEVPLRYPTLASGSYVQVPEPVDLMIRYPVETLGELASNLTDQIDQLQLETLVRLVTADRRFDTTMEYILLTLAQTAQGRSLSFTDRVTERRQRAPDGFWRARITAYLEQQPLGRDLEAFRPWAAEYLGCADYPLSRRIKLYDRLTKLHALDCLIHSQLDAVDLGVGRMYSKLVDFVYTVDAPARPPADPSAVPLFKGPLAWTTPSFGSLSMLKEWNQVDTTLIHRQVFGKDDVDGEEEFRRLYRHERTVQLPPLPAQARRGVAKIRAVVALLRGDQTLEILFTSGSEDSRFRVLLTHPGTEPWFQAMDLIPPDREPGVPGGPFGSVRWGQIEGTFAGACLPPDPMTVRARTFQVAGTRAKSYGDPYRTVFSQELSLLFGPRTAAGH
ncbi:MAG: hypothetical protein HY815_28935 [Candidatus Riflebacteria bacterium]|nr:hypothetical protein [Candidatus Riflebacteria bacterium]